jgi:predicted DCC family thiol-disulfide oxidoreductase YuxK
MQLNAMRRSTWRSEIFPALVLFDGLCGLCDRTVRFIIDHDPKGNFSFAPLQSPIAKQFLGQDAETVDELSSVVLVEDGKIYRRSTATLRIVRQLRAPLPVLYCLIVLPLPLRDKVYDWIARHRYRWFGQLDACRMPQAATERRFLHAASPCSGASRTMNASPSRASTGLEKS